MNRTLIPLAVSLFVLAACGTDTSTAPGPLATQALFARAPASTPYAFALLSGLQTDASYQFSALAKPGDPFGGSGIDADGVYSHFRNPRALNRASVMPASRADHRPMRG